MFDRIHVNHLVYNTCWEDPRCDRNLLQLDQESEVVMITSAGCNALAYLLDNPASIHCVDVNPRQNALLDLKLSLFEKTDHSTLFQFFGKGTHPQYEALYEEHLRDTLGKGAQIFWDKQIKYFSDKPVRKNFYHHGTAGAFVWLFSGYLKGRKSLYQQVQKLLAASSLDEQREIYDRIEQKLLNRLVEVVMNRHFTMCLLGVPRSQQELFFDAENSGAMGFIQQCLRHVFTELPIHDNYFYRVYINGEYSEDCCPEYLKSNHFDILKDRTDRVCTHSTTLSDFLIHNPGSYSHFVLLDHQDWLADNDIEALEEEWELILRNSHPGTKILLRSAAERVDFFPDFVLDRLEFEQSETAVQHRLDRVGTYASVYLGRVR